MRLPFSGKREKVNQPLGKLESYADYVNAVRRLARATVPQGAVGAMAAVGGARAALAGGQQPSDQDQLVIASVRQLAGCGDEAASAMVNIVLSGGPERGFAMLVLELMGSRAVPSITKGLSQNHNSARKWLLVPLHNMGGPEAAAAEQSVLNDTDESVANAANAILEGKEMPGSEKLGLLAGMTPDERASAAVDLAIWLEAEGFL
jgi:hypothetical protein